MSPKKKFRFFSNFLGAAGTKRLCGKNRQFDSAAPVELSWIRPESWINDQESREN